MNYSKLITCQHCGNVATMKIVGEVNDAYYENFAYNESEWLYSTFYSVLKCPACEKVNIVKYDFDDSMSDNDIKYEFLYPKNSTYPIGLPEKILNAYKAAEQVKTIDVNAYAILMRRLLELVCIDRNAKIDNLSKMLKELAERNEIPEKLVKVAEGLKNFGNIGAHASNGDLTENELPIVNALSSAILEYVYSAPHLATIAEDKINVIKNKK